MEKDKTQSSYQKGIANLLEKHQEEFENIIAEYILEVHNKYYSNTFPSTQICKILLNKINKSQTKFSIFHKVVRNILKGWENRDICKVISQRKSHSLKTVVKFDKTGFQQLKQKIIDFSIKTVKDGIQDKDFSVDSLKTRDKILEDFEYEIQDLFSILENDEEE